MEKKLSGVAGLRYIMVCGKSQSKGHAAKIWLEKLKWDFVLAAGDDYTDEDLFAVLPENAYSIKVGSGLSKARFNLDSMTELRGLLKELIKKTKN